MARRVIAICGDTHCGSTVGLCPPEGMELDDGGLYETSEAQHWLWAQWVDGWKQAKRIIRKSPFELVLNGDLIDGDHHRTSQIASVLTGIHLRCAVDSLREPLALKPSAVHVMRGTPSHVGRSAEVEEGIARVLRAEGWPVKMDPNTGKASSYRRRLDVDGVRLDIAHHGRMGQRAHTKGSYSKLYAFDVFAEQMLEMYTAMKAEPDSIADVFHSMRPPDIAIRSHNHKFMDSGPDHRGVTRLISMPAFQFATEFVYRIAAESLADIGIVVIVIEDGRYEVHPILFPAARSKTMGAK